MFVMMNKIFIILFTLLILQESIATTKCDLKSIFLTPDEIAKRKFDQFQIIERSSFNDKVPDTNFQSSNTEKTDNTLNKNPQSFANAQVLLRIGNEDLSRFKYPTDFSRHLQNYYHPNMFYPPMLTPQLQNGLTLQNLLNYLIQSQYLSQNPLYFTNPMTSVPKNNFQREPIVDLKEDLVKASEKLSESPQFYTILQGLNEPKNTQDMDLVDKVEENFITRIVNKDHPKILQPLDLSDDKIKSQNNDDAEDSKTASKNKNKIEDSIKEKEKTERAGSVDNNKKKHSIPTLLNKKSGKLLVTYPMNDGDEKPSACKNCQRDPSIAFGKRFPTDIDDLSKFQEVPIQPKPQSCKHCQRDPNIAFGKRFPVDINDLSRFPEIPLLRTNQIPEENSLINTPCIWENIRPQIQRTISPPNYLPMIIPDYKPNVYFNSYRASSGSNSYSDPFKSIIFHHPSQIEFIRSTNVQQPQIQVTNLEVPSLYQVIPRYNIIPKYNILPERNYEPPAAAGHLWTKMMEMSQANIGGTRSYCPTCARYYKELNE